MSLTTAPMCSCGLPLTPVRTSSGASRLLSCDHCDSPCPRKRCVRCSRAGVKR